jgi:hypothetical protein
MRRGLVFSISWALDVKADWFMDQSHSVAIMICIIMLQLRATYELNLEQPVLPQILGWLRPRVDVPCPVTNNSEWNPSRRHWPQVRAAFWVLFLAICSELWLHIWQYNGMGSCPPKPARRWANSVTIIQATYLQHDPSKRVHIAFWSKYQCHVAFIIECQVFWSHVWRGARGIGG